MLLIVFPAASWYYLNSGLQYRRSTMAELKEYGTFPSENWPLADGSQLSEEFLKKKMLLAHQMPDAGHPELVKRYGETLRRLHDQFEERDELIFLTLLHGDSARVGQQLMPFAETYELEDQPHQFFIRLDDNEFASLGKEVLQPKSEAASDLEEPSAFFLLTDTTATIRRYYDIREESDIRRLVEHIALLLPFKKDRELIFKREVEK
ncbi:hypothetical protein CRP01_18460 [Flavilitoribacter nigricans DSM 23189 = NBRC 102662]|uniref:Alkyl hydroperoxide reductase subunit C/ Thiol specific antioxidant domain-containing protein n=2 Tax=Flavilitoribacter TaxID=2762562 RepID=A0A2D0N915_FLAN2|nr:hypothetical protein CRP01_18460 [Flavilitoribacter nigricans DSM 23189 = NBRC 102662]